MNCDCLESLAYEPLDDGKKRASEQLSRNRFSGHVLYCAGDDNKTTAGTGFYVLASLAFIRLHTLNYTGNDGTTGNDDFRQTTHVRVNG
uniref:Uncharacterized protein n=1 Tax=Plectus sambesii TaxID=2011161 RepID=A0A914W081_9BILA